MNRQQIRRHDAIPALSRSGQRRPERDTAASSGMSVLRMQALAGNRAVAQVLGARPLMQRCGTGADCGCVDGDDAGTVQREPASAPLVLVQRDAAPLATDQHDLISPRFANDPILEACFDDKARLAVGARGPAVIKVQQALIDLGSDLGPSGVDGTYGQLTATAVKKFKADHRLGFETFGDVGPGTMGRLDQLFPPDPPRPADQDRAARILEDGSAPVACPTPAEIEVVLAGSPSLRNQLVGAGPGTATPPAASACQPAGTHVRIPDAVTCFSSKVDVTSPVAFLNVSAAGQFFPYYELRGTINTELSRLEASATSRSDTDLTNFVAQARRAKTLIHGHKPTTSEFAQMKAIIDRTSSPEKPAMKALVAPADRATVVEAFVWSGVESTDRVPGLSRFASLNTLHDLYELVCGVCGAHANRVAQRLKRKGGIVGKNARVAPVHAKLVAGPALRNRLPVPFPGGDRHLGDVVPQQGVAAAVAAMKRALDAGQLVHARVLSGVGYGTNPNVPPEPRSKPTTLPTSPPEEHSLLIFGFDRNEFVFNDPDAAMSHAHGTGFGSLTFDPATGRLSTAANAASFIVDAHGVHASDEKRYQILTLNTI